tara:strand:- start:50 stop:658 length:609 start_codon:yes stop_codon:yes gene_type:complete
MKKITFTLAIISFYTSSIDAQFIEIKKEKAFPAAKIAKSQKDIPLILENSVIIKSAKQSIKNLDTITTRGDFSYSLEPLTVKLIAPQSALSNLGNELQENLPNNSLVELGPIDKENLKVTLVGPSKKAMISDGSFLVGFINKDDQINFSTEYKLEEVQKYPDYILYRASSFNGINDLLKRINQDSRISFLELNLIDPDIKIN